MNHLPWSMHFNLQQIDCVSNVESSMDLKTLISQAYTRTKGWWVFSSSRVLKFPVADSWERFFALSTREGAPHLFTQSTRVRPVITKLWCQIIGAGCDLKLRITAYSLFSPSGSAEQKVCDLGRQPRHCGNKRCKVIPVTYWFPAVPLAFSLSVLAAHLQTKASLLLLESYTGEFLVVKHTE